MVRFIKFGAMRLGSFFITNAIALLLLYEFDEVVYGAWASYVVPVEYLFAILVSAMLIIFSDRKYGFDSIFTEKIQVRDLLFLFVIFFLVSWFGLLTQWWHIYLLSVLFLLYSERISALLFVTKNELVAQLSVKIMYPSLLAIFLVPILWKGEGAELLFDVAYAFFYASIITSGVSLFFFCKYFNGVNYEPDGAYQVSGEVETQDHNFLDWLPKVFFAASMSLLPVFPILFLTAHDGGTHIQYYKRVEVFGGLVCILYALFLTFITPRLGRARSPAVLQRYLRRLLPILRIVAIIVGAGLLFVWAFFFETELVALLYLSSLIFNISLGPNFFVMMFLSGGVKAGSIVIGSISCVCLVGMLMFPTTKWTPIALFSSATIVSNMLCFLYLFIRFRVRTDIFLR
ncbi:hypothetical protein N9X85_05010 [Luminiphilus sp.]|nr:hypothetical protein [Luminiphilus sp.]